MGSDFHYSLLQVQSLIRLEYCLSKLTSSIVVVEVLENTLRFPFNLLHDLLNGETWKQEGLRSGFTSSGMAYVASSCIPRSKNYFRYPSGEGRWSYSLVRWTDNSEDVIRIRA